MLQNTMKSPVSEHSTNFYSWPSANTVHLAGTLFTSPYAKESHWITDFGATDHITSQYDTLINPIPCHALLHLPNGITINVTHVGTVCLSSDITLNQVLCVPTFTHNLLSISKLLKDTNFRAVFSDGTCSLQDPTRKRELEIGKFEDGLYMFNSSVMVSTESLFFV